MKDVKKHYYTQKKTPHFIKLRHKHWYPKAVPINPSEKQSPTMPPALP